MDVNGTKFHLLLSRADWGNCKSAQDGEALDTIWKRESKVETTHGQQFGWNAEANEITLQPRLFKFTASPKDEKPDLNNRRGAARDRYGNWFWIDETGLKINALSTGSKQISDFYPAAGVCAQETNSDFQQVETVAQTPFALCGLAVTIDHYLVVGTTEPQGLLIFDLFSVGEPRRIVWQNDVDFVPFDISARRGGGVFVLDRKNRRYWTLDRGFNAVGAKTFEAEETADDFQPLDKSAERRRSRTPSAENFFSELASGAEPISIESLPDDTVLILNLPQSEDFSIIYRYYRGQKLDELNTASISSKVIEDEDRTSSPPKKFRLRGYDIAFVEAVEAEKRDRVYIVSEEGNQAFAFSLICEDEFPVSPALDLPSHTVRKNFRLEPVEEYFPMRLYGGKGFAAAGGEVYFDFGERWLPLIRQNRPRFVTEGTLETPVFDGKEPNCVWHRLMLDGCISPETKVEIYSRNADDEDDLQLASWRKEPDFYLRGNGSEFPFAGNYTSKEKGKGTWELLLQRAKGRYLQLRLAFSGNGQRTPRISALRAYYPRFSYLNNYLPSIYREDEQSAFFLDRFLANFEGFYTTIEDKIAAAQMLFDVRSAPPDALDWLANWFGVALDPAWTEAKRRLFISRAVDFFQYRGTMRGLRTALRLVIDSCADERIFEPQTSKEKLLDPIRIVERFQTRRTPEIIPADVAAQQNLPRITEKTAKWTPAQGADVLHRRYREKFEDKPNLKFPLIKPPEAEDAGIWEQFALEALGFVLSSAAETLRRKWRSFLRDRYKNEISRLNAAHKTSFEDFDKILLPNGIETSAALQTDWQDFGAQTSASNRNQKLWQDFLARRYRQIGKLNSFYGTNWSSFELIPLFDELPFLDKPLADWFQFESAVLAMHRTAHRFTVLIPAVLSGNNVETPQEQKRKLELVRRVVELEKPAHTVCDFRYYWNLFRLEEVRLGLDTLLGLGSRDPQLNPSLVIGQSYVGESRLGVNEPEKYSSRYVLGNEGLKQNKKDKKL
jgi:phage tail-like protein